MIICSPETLESSGIEFRIQTFETTQDFVLIRIRTEEKIPSGIRDVKVPALSREKFVLRDGRGTELGLIQISSQGEGPFDGIVDLAFPSEPAIDLDSALTLDCGRSRLSFKL